MNPEVSGNGMAALLYNLLGGTFLTVCLALMPLSFALSILHYRLWDVDVVISPYKDDYLFYGSSMKLLEYLAAGKATVSPALGQIKELIADGYNGLLHEPGDYPALTRKLSELIENPDMRRQLGINARRTIERGWTWE